MSVQTILNMKHKLTGSHLEYIMLIISATSFATRKIHTYFNKSNYCKYLKIKGVIELKTVITRDNLT